MIARISVLLALVVMGECFPPQGNPCPGSCSCKIIATFHHVNCSDSDLKEFPENLDPMTSTLIFNRNGLIKLRNNTFEYHLNILQLYLDHNRISSLDVATFWNLRDLRVLFLDHNLLKEIPQDAFVKNMELIWLDLSGNMLLIPERGVLLKSDSLTQLTLSECNFENLTPDMFDMTVKLEKLDLRNNKIETLDLETFKHLSSLTNLNLMGNNLNCNCDIFPFHYWTENRGVKIKAECSDDLPWIRARELECASVSKYTWVGVGVGVLLMLVSVAVVTYYVCRCRKLSAVQRRRRPPLPSLPAGPSGEYIEVVAEKTYESIRETEVARYMTSLTANLTPPETSDGPIYVNSFVAPSAPKSRRDRVPTYDDVRPPSPTANAAKMDAKARCMSLASILKDCDYYETVD